MGPRAFSELAGRLMRHPAAPYHEHAVREEVQRICDEHRLDYQRDPFGNVLVKLKTAPRQRPVVLAAHLDHPGFELVQQVSKKRVLAKFRGGVADSYFRRGVPIRLMPGAILAKLGARKSKDRVFEIHASRALETLQRFAVWELEDFAVRNQRIYGRACDDLVGVASVLATIIELKRSRARVHVIGAISRAEEVGFHGALAMAATRGLPRNSLIISLETSRELPGVKMGRGVIIRIGDRTSIFDSEASRFLMEVAAQLQAGSTGFFFQRGLMSGGTCEATAYQEFGLQTAAVCVALGNYHNCADHNRIKAEYVSIPDACGMVDLLVAAAKNMRQFAGLVGKLPTRLKQMSREAQSKLRKTSDL